MLLGEDDQAQLKLLLRSREEPVLKRKKQSRGQSARRDVSESDDDDLEDEEQLTYTCFFCFVFVG